MRPKPRPRHLIAIAILAGTAALYALLAWQECRLSDAQVHATTVALKEHRHDLYARDPFFSRPPLWNAHNPLFTAMVAGVLRLGGWQDLLLPYRLMVPLVAMLYLCSMYALLYRQCRNWSVAVFVAVLSSAVTDTLGPAYWGLGALDTMTSAAWVQALVPLIVLAFLRWQQAGRLASTRHLLLLFVLIGLLGNLSPAWAMNLTVVLLAVHLALRRFSPRALLTGLALGLAALAGALPYLIYFYRLRVHLAGPDAFVRGGRVFEALRMVDPQYLYPDMPRSLLNWALLAALLVVPAVLTLARYERYRSRDLKFWVLFGSIALGVALVFQAASQLVGYLTRMGPPTVEFVHASSLAMVALYVLFAQSLGNLFRLVKVHRALLRSACALLAAIYMIPSDNLRPLRHALVDTMTMAMEEVDKPEFIRDRHEDEHRRYELRAISAWADRHTPTDAVFVTELSEFRMAARRSIVAARHDIRIIYYLAPWLLDEWVTRLDRMTRVLNPRTGKIDPEALTVLAGEFAHQAPFRGAGAWFVIARAPVAPEGQGVLDQVPAEGWGRFYRVFKLPAPAP
ncbi:MAG: hypothetical protein BWX88_00108 [Planctomycetes bacterium ADurb.Bin126]|nr:MAG: hypothetical protein BWX88_00108 [Planctomycetes bacterium ADurb.Bin126]HOD82222.1 hypothetical protein [Phycisphaerae bacterium]HQL74658.1 hypothetical protein [Phycisphaerae bacterium]